MNFGCFHRGHGVHNRDEDRRLPIVKRGRAYSSLFEDAQSRSLIHADDDTYGWDHVQYLGEHAVRKYRLKKPMTSNER